MSETGVTLDHDREYPANTLHPVKHRTEIPAAYPGMTGKSLVEFCSGYRTTCDVILWLLHDQTIKLRFHRPSSRSAHCDIRVYPLNHAQARDIRKRRIEFSPQSRSCVLSWAHQLMFGSVAAVRSLARAACSIWRTRCLLRPSMCPTCSSVAGEVAGEMP